MNFDATQLFDRYLLPTFGIFIFIVCIFLYPKGDKSRIFGEWLRYFGVLVFTAILILLVI